MRAQFLALEISFNMLRKLLNIHAVVYLCTDLSYVHEYLESENAWTAIISKNLSKLTGLSMCLCFCMGVYVYLLNPTMSPQITQASSKNFSSSSTDF